MASTCQSVAARQHGILLDGSRDLGTRLRVEFTVGAAIDLGPRGHDNIYGGGLVAADLPKSR